MAGAGRKIGIPYGSNPETCPVRTRQERRISAEGVKRILAATKKRWRLKRAEVQSRTGTGRGEEGRSEEGGEEYCAGQEGGCEEVGHASRTDPGDSR